MVDIRGCFWNNILSETKPKIWTLGLIYYSTNSENAIHPYYIAHIIYMIRKLKVAIVNFCFDINLLFT